MTERRKEGIKGAVSNNKGGVGKATSAVNLATKHRRQTEWRKQAESLDEIKDWQGMINWCLKWTKSEPESAYAWSSLGIAYANLKCHDDAINAYRKALRIDPDKAKVWHILGYSYERLKRHDEAIEAFRKALQIDPDKAYAWNGLGNIYNDLKCHNDAIDAYREALRIDPEYTSAWSGLGIAYLKLFHDVIRELRRLDPAKADKLLNLTMPR